MQGAILFVDNPFSYIPIAAGYMFCMIFHFLQMHIINPSYINYTIHITTYFVFNPSLFRQRICTLHVLVDTFVEVAKENCVRDVSQRAIEGESM